MLLIGAQPSLSVPCSAWRGRDYAVYRVLDLVMNITHSRHAAFHTYERQLMSQIHEGDQGFGKNGYF